MSECMFILLFFLKINMDNKTKFKTLVIIDLETTGLIDDEPKITELAMIAVNM
jgi:DNA polymerase III epsilon subunit-like protein